MPDQAPDFSWNVGMIALVMTGIVIAAMAAGAGLFAGALALLGGLR